MGHSIRIAFSWDIAGQLRWRTRLLRVCVHFVSSHFRFSYKSLQRALAGALSSTCYQNYSTLHSFHTCTTRITSCICIRPSQRDLCRSDVVAHVFSSHHSFGPFFVYSFFHLVSLFYLSFPKTGRWTGLADCELVLCRLGLKIGRRGIL